MKLAFERVEGTEPEAEILFLHGILGRGANLRTLAKRFVAACPGWSAVLVDLRGHGGSKDVGAEPDTLEQCARDVLESLAWGPRPVAAVFGHSFGGKVALEMARDGRPVPIAGTSPARPCRHYVVVDSLPGPRASARGSEATLEVIELLASLPGPFSTRQAFIAALSERGLSQGIAEWLGTSLRKDGDGFWFGIDLGRVRALLSDYFAQDLWAVVEAPAHDAHVHLVIGDRSTVYDAAARERARALEAQSPAARVTVDVLSAGHWVHVDAADALLEVLVCRVGPARTSLNTSGVELEG